MNLVERLVQADINKALELKRKTVKSSRLAQILGEDEPVDVEIKEIPQRKLNDIMAMQYSSSGKFQISQTFDAKLMSLVEGVVNPSLRDKDLQTHFHAETPKKLAEILFGSEVTKISDEILSISGVSEDDEEEVKN